jgi:hypothetical protein
VGCARTRRIWRGGSGRGQGTHHRTLLLLRVRDPFARPLTDTMSAFRASPGSDWSVRFYQYANCLAHLHLLQDLNNVSTRLVFLYFVGDPDVNGSDSRQGWEAAIAVLHEALGTKGRAPGLRY